MKMEAELGGEGFRVGTEFVFMAALFEGDEELIGNRATKGLPAHFHIAISGDGNRRGDRGFGQGTAECPAAQHVPGGNFGDALELDELVFSRLGEFDAFKRDLHNTIFYEEEETRSVHLN